MQTLFLTDPPPVLWTLRAYDDNSHVAGTSATRLRDCIALRCVDPRKRFSVGDPDSDSDSEPEASAGVR